MRHTPIVRYLNPWQLKREKQQQRLAELRKRDGDACWRCRRPMRFDVPPGHHQAPAIEPILPRSMGGTAQLDNLCLCHARCNAMTGDSTLQVQERLRLRA